MLHNGVVIAPAEVPVGDARNGALQALSLGLCRGADARERSQRSPPSGSSLTWRRNMLWDDTHR